MKKLKSFGKALYELRISKNISLEKISEITKINQAYFEEFEKGNFDINIEVYIRLFLREYIRCIDSDKVDDILNKFEIAYNGKSKKETLTFIPDDNQDQSDSSDNFNNILNNQQYTPKKIAIIIIIFLIIIFVFRIVMYLSYSS